MAKKALTLPPLAPVVIAAWRLFFELEKLPDDEPTRSARELARFMAQALQGPDASPVAGTNWTSGNIDARWTLLRKVAKGTEEALAEAAGASPYRMTAPKHVMELADDLDRQRTGDPPEDMGPAVARRTLVMLSLGSSPVASFVVKRWRHVGARDRDLRDVAVRLARDSRPLDGERMVTLALHTVGWQKPSSLFSSRDVRTKDKSSAVRK